MPPYMLPPTLQQLQADAFTKIYRKGVASSMFCSSKWLECLQIMGHDLCASVEMEMFGLVFDCYGWSAMICTSRVPYCAHLWTFVNCFVSIYRCFFACFWKMYDVWYNFSGTDKAIPQRWSSQQPTSHVTTPWCHNRCGLDSVHGLDQGTSPFFAASWLVDSLLQVAEGGW